ncbi:MAG: hypothetical protein M5U22_14255 [Thermoleophilia bacterium]|nr:hypothetical protein [Thermoleophilia bacterium]
MEVSEVLLPASDAASLFAVQLPAEYEFQGDEALPADPNARNRTIAEASKEVKFQLFWLGPQFGDLPLARAQVLEDGSVTLVYASFSAETAGLGKAYRQVYFHEYDLDDPEAKNRYTGPGVELVDRAAMGEETFEIRVDTSTGSDVPFLTFERSGTFIVLIEGPTADRASLLDTAAALKEVSP